MGKSGKQAIQLSFSRFLRLGFQGSRITSDGGLIPCRRRSHSASELSSDSVQLRGTYCDEVSSSAHRRSMKRRISSFIFVPATVQAILKRRCCARGKSTVKRESFSGLTGVFNSVLPEICFSVSFPTPPLTKVSISSDVGCLLGSGFVRFFLLIELSDFLHNSCQLLRRRAPGSPLENSLPHS